MSLSQQRFPKERHCARRHGRRTCSGQCPATIGHFGRLPPASTTVPRKTKESGWVQDPWRLLWCIGADACCHGPVSMPPSPSHTPLAVRARASNNSYYTTTRTPSIPVAHTAVLPASPWAYPDASHRRGGTRGGEGLPWWCWLFVAPFHTARQIDTGGTGKHHVQC